MIIRSKYIENIRCSNDRRVGGVTRWHIGAEVTINCSISVYMALLPLPPQVISHIRSGVSLVSPSQCLSELILNSIDAGATNIVTHLDLSCHKMQVKDNGVGMTYEQLKLVGERYCTSKCSSVSDLNDLKSYGYRGEALASLREISGMMEIVSRTASCDETFCKLFIQGEAKEVMKSSANREQNGTTITIIDFMYNLPVRKKLISETLDLEHCRSSLAQIALIHPHISFVLHNDVTEEIILQTHKSKSILASFVTLFGQKKAERLKSVLYSVSPYTITGYISLESHSSKDLQFLYVNNRIVLKTKVHKIINSLLRKYLLVSYRIPTLNSSPSKSSQDRNGIFILNICCPSDSYDLCLEPKKSLIEFKEWIKVLNVIEKCICCFLKNNNIAVEESEICNDLFSPLAGHIGCDDEHEINTHNAKNALFSLIAKRGKIHDSKENDNLNQEKHVEKDFVENFASTTENCGKAKTQDNHINEANCIEKAKLLHVRSQFTVKMPYDNRLLTAGILPSSDHSEEVPNKNIRSTLTAFKRKTKKEEVVSSQASPKEKYKFITVGKRVIRLPAVMKPYYSRNSLQQLKSAKESKFTKLKKPNENKRINKRKAKDELRNFNESWNGCELKQVFNSSCDGNDGLGCHNTNNDVSKNIRRKPCNSETSQTNKTNEEIGSIPFLEPDNNNATEICEELNNTRTVTEQSSRINPCQDIPMDVHPSHNPNCISSLKCPSSQDTEKFSDSLCSPSLERKLPVNKFVSDHYSQVAKIKGNLVKGNSEVCVSQVHDFQMAEKSRFELDRTVTSNYQEINEIGEESSSSGTTKYSFALGCDTNYRMPMEGNDKSTRTKPVVATSIARRKFTKIICSPVSNDERLKEKLWICYKDRVSGKSIYVNSINANSSYIPPEIEASTNTNIDISENNTRSHFFLSHNSTPFLPRPSFQRSTIWTKLKTRALPQCDTIALQNMPSPQLQLKGLNNDKVEGNINDMFQKWKNPVFQKQDLKEISDISLKQFARREIKICNLTQAHNLSKSELDTAKVIGQADSKFIACLVPKTDKNIQGEGFIVLFDQHAVHERIRLEQLIQELYEDGSAQQIKEDGSAQQIKLSSLEPAVNIKLRPEEVRIIKAYHNELNKLGFRVHIKDQNSATVDAVPTCLLEKDAPERKKGKLPTTAIVIQTIIKEWVQMLQETGVATSLPKTLLSVLNSQACYGAIKFGDHLETAECSKLIKMLTSCKLPFQCAHGRPSLVPLVDLSSLRCSENTMAKPKLWKLASR